MLRGDPLFFEQVLRLNNDGSPLNLDSLSRTLERMAVGGRDIKSSSFLAGKVLGCQQTSWMINMSST